MVAVNAYSIPNILGSTLQPSPESPTFQYQINNSEIFSAKLNEIDKEISKFDPPSNTKTSVPNQCGTTILPSPESLNPMAYHSQIPYLLPYDHLLSRDPNTSTNPNDHLISRDPKNSVNPDDHSQIPYLLSRDLKSSTNPDDHLLSRYQNSKKLEELNESHESRSPSSSTVEAEINDMQFKYKSYMYALITGATLKAFNGWFLWTRMGFLVYQVLGIHLL